MLLEVGLALGVATLLKVLTHKHEKIKRIYSQPDNDLRQKVIANPFLRDLNKIGPFYYIKWMIFYVLYRRRTSRVLRRSRNYDHGSDLRYLENEETIASTHIEDFGSGEKRKMPPEFVERPQPVADSQFAIDAVYFNGFEVKNPTISDDVTLVMGFTNRFRSFAEILFFIKVPGVGFLQHPAHPDRIICDATSDEYQYRGQGMVIEMLEPMRRWRVKYNGLMRVMDVTDRHVEKKSDKLIHVKFSFIWRSYSDVTDFDTDISAQCMARAFASEEWTRDFFDKVQQNHSHQSHYEQWGQLQGVLQIENDEPKELLMRGFRDHSYSRRDWRQFHRYLICMIYLEDGTSISLGAICMDATVSRFTMGYIIHPNHTKEAIDYVDIRLWEFGEDGRIPREIVCNFTAGGKKYNVVCQIRIIPEFYNGFQWEGKLVETLADYYVNGIPGRGIAEFCYRHDHDLRTIDECEESETKLLQEPDLKHEDFLSILTITLNDELCRKRSLVGGKSSQVATLMSWSEETDKENKELKNLLSTLQSESPAYSKEHLEDLCLRISEAFENSTMATDMIRQIDERYNLLDDTTLPIVAVRSSATGEDTIDLSAAGQLETFLGVSGSENLIKHIKKCWASQYHFGAVVYRRQHGQALKSTMGVLVQCIAKQTKASGVMFTQHPVTGHPLHTLINCNYGLGETVVSGTAEPDTILVHCYQNNNPKIIQKNIGTKKKMMKVSGKGGVEEVNIETNQSSAICLSEDEILELVEIGNIIERYSGSARDIEWAISSGGKISLLQSRPITTDPTETDFEIVHEFDSAVSNDNYLLTTANIGEMMPGPITPLTNSVFMRSMDYAMQGKLMDGLSSILRYPDPQFFETAVPRGPFPYNDVIVVSSHGHLFLNYVEMLRTNENSVISVSKDSLDVNLLGKICDKISMQQVIKYHGRFGLLTRLTNAIRFYRKMYNAERYFDKLFQECKDFRLEGETAKDLYKDYMGYAAASGSSTTVLMMILSQGKSEWKTEHYSDVAMIYGNCENTMESIDPPTLIERTAKILSESDDKEQFLAMKPEDATKWLIFHNGEAGQTFQKLLQDCGHRCIRESELHEKSWASDPGKLGSSLQASVKSYIGKKTKVTEDPMANIKTPLSFLARIILKFAIPRARKAVAGRENGKSKMVKIADLFKRGYWKLADLLEKEGYLPEADLTFFLTHGEIGRLLKNRSPRLVSRANKRRKVYKDAHNFEFDEFQTKCPPKPTNVEDEMTNVGIDFTLYGFPVSHGTVKGSARIVSRLDDANEIQKGDILIVRTTDVGWSPYFPLISGLVTEIGGLISHGATVAREFGLPCIVGAKKATQLFTSGDSVFLDGGRGVIRKLEV